MDVCHVDVFLGPIILLQDNVIILVSSYVMLYSSRYLLFITLSSLVVRVSQLGYMNQASSVISTEELLEWFTRLFGSVLRLC
jgi:hypothetical protein